MPTSHRAPSSSDPVRRMLPPLAAVAAVVAVILVLLWLNSPGNTSGPGPALQPPVAHTTAASASPSASPRPSASASHSPRAHPHRTAPVSEPPATQKPAVRPIPLTVLNNSRRSGLAHRAAAQVADRGWPIRLIGNFTGRIPVSTVYYAAGQEPQARLLAKQFPAVQRVLPRFDGLPGHGLTLVVTREWPA